MTSRAWTITGLALVLALIIVLQLLARRERATIPSLKDLFAAATARPIGRFITMAVWVWVGWHFFAR